MLREGRKPELWNSFPTKGVCSEKDFPRLCPSVNSSQSLVGDGMRCFYAPAKTVKSLNFYFSRMSEDKVLLETMSDSSCDVARLFTRGC